MEERLNEIIKYKTRGKKKEFAELLGWSQQYLSKLLHGEDFGLKPVLTILEACPEINARWFLLGHGGMFMDDKVSDLRRGAFNHIQAVLELERYVPVMSPEELREYEQMITGHKRPDFSPEVKLRWIEQIHDAEQERDNRIEKAMKQSDKLCKRQTAKK